MTATAEHQVVQGEVVGSTDAAPETTPSTEVEPAGLSFKEETEAFARLDAFSSALVDYVKKRRPLMMAALLEQQEATDAKKFNVRMDGQIVAAMTITDPSDKYAVADEEALIDFLLDDPDFANEVETITRVRPAFLKKLTEKLVTGDKDGVFLSDHKDVPERLVGTEVKCLKFIPAPPASSFSTRWADQERKQAVLDEVVEHLVPVLGALPGIEK